MEIGLFRVFSSVNDFCCDVMTGFCVDDFENGCVMILNDFFASEIANEIANDFFPMVVGSYLMCINIVCNFTLWNCAGGSVNQTKV